MFWALMLSMVLLGSVCYQSPGNHSWGECVCLFVCVLEGEAGPISHLTLHVELRAVLSLRWHVCACVCVGSG